jgi:hypothetical protein
MTAASHSADASFVIQSRLEGGAPGGRRTFATITCRSCGKTDDTPLKDKNAGWARRVFKSRGWSVADRAGRHQCPTCAQGPRGLGGRSVRELGGGITVMARKHPDTANRRDLLNDSSLTNGVLEMHNSEGHQNIDPDLMKPDRMAEALSHLGHVTQHVEPPAPAPKPPASPRSRPPQEVKWKATGRTGSLPISPKPLNLPEFLTPPKPARQYKRKLSGYRYPGDAAYIARVYLRACGIRDPQIGRDFIVWASDDEIGWALPPKPSGRAAALQQVLEAYRPVLAEGADPNPTTTAVEPAVTTSEEPMSPTLTAVPPARPSRDKLLAIHEKLNAVYLTEGAGRYTGVWSDAKVAAELDVPPAWVVEERSRVYGEGTDNDAGNIALDKWRRDMTNRMAKATERQAKAIEELLAVNTEIEAIKATMSAGPKEG